MMPEALELAQRTLDWFKPCVARFAEEAEVFAAFPSLFLGMVNEKGTLDHYDGMIRMTDASGAIVEDGVEPEKYQELIGEAVEPFSFMKFPYYRRLGYPEGMYRVGPLARLNVAKACGTPLADGELDEFRAFSGGRPQLSSFHYHWARLIEIVHGIERITRLLGDPRILDPFVRARARPNRREGVGVAEAPRGTLMHHYRIDEDGLITWANLVIATGHNNLAMNRGILQAARRFVSGDRISEGALNRVEAVIRCFDPCLSCATHAVGRMPLRIELLDRKGAVLHEIQRD
jgi:NAD-reducing hydrogenase large subunit